MTMDLSGVLGLSLRYGHAASFPAVWAIHAVSSDGSIHDRDAYGFSGVRGCDGLPMLFSRPCSRYPLQLFRVRVVVCSSSGALTASLLHHSCSRLLLPRVSRRVCSPLAVSRTLVGFPSWTPPFMIAVSSPHAGMCTSREWSCRLHAHEAY